MHAPVCTMSPVSDFPLPSATGKHIAGNSRQVPPTVAAKYANPPKTLPQQWRFSSNSGANRDLLFATPPFQAILRVLAKNVLPKTQFVLLRFSFSYPFSFIKSVKLSSSMTLLMTKYWRTFSNFISSLSVCSRSSIVRVSFMAPPVTTYIPGFSLIA